MLKILLNVTCWLLPAVIELPSLGAVESICMPPEAFLIVKDPNILELESSITRRVAWDDETIFDTYKLKFPDEVPPATKPDPKPTKSPTLKEEIEKEPPLETTILEDISDSLASCDIVKLKSEREPGVKLLKLTSTTGLKSDWE